MRVAVSMGISHREGREVDFLRHPYVPYLQGLGLLPLLVPNVVSDVAAYVDALDVCGIVLTGGADIDPARYHQENHHAILVSQVRDAAETQLLDLALRRNLPVFGICRGMQFINVYFGGALVQDIPAEIGDAVDHSDTGGRHSLAVVDARFEALLGTATIETNTHHHQAATRSLVGADLDVFAISEVDGVVEGVAHRQHPVLGVQWHPELPEACTDVDRVLIQRLFSEGAFWTG